VPHLRGDSIGTGEPKGSPLLGGFYHRAISSPFDKVRALLYN